MIDAREAYKKTSEICDSIIREKFEEFKEEADKSIAKAISNGRWSCYIPCDSRVRDLVSQWLKNYGYLIDVDLIVIESDSIYVNWGDAGSSLRGE